MRKGRLPKGACSWPCIRYTDMPLAVGAAKVNATWTPSLALSHTRRRPAFPRWSSPRFLVFVLWQQNGPSTPNWTESFGFDDTRNIKYYFASSGPAWFMVCLPPHLRRGSLVSGLYLRSVGGRNGSEAQTIVFLCECGLTSPRVQMPVPRLLKEPCAVSLPHETKRPELAAETQKEKQERDPSRRRPRDRRVTNTMRTSPHDERAVVLSVTPR